MQQNKSCIQILNAKGEVVGHYAAPDKYEFDGRYLSPRIGDGHGFDIKNLAIVEASPLNYFMIKPLPTAKERRAERLKKMLSFKFTHLENLTKCVEDIESLFTEEQD